MAIVPSKNQNKENSNFTTCFVFAPLAIYHNAFYFSIITNFISNELKKGGSSLRTEIVMRLGTLKYSQQLRI